MRLRVGLVLCLFLAFLGAGCRKALGPNVDDNQAPETWITAAPQDTITTRSPLGVPTDPVIGRIPVRFHMYWAGADRDGEVAGFYWAVVETLATPPGDGLPIPNLPGPKARDYHFTTKTDSIFIFTASEDVPERQHAFYVYAVDNKGKPDPSPARFIFRAYDRFPPLAIIDEAKAVGRIYRLNSGGGVTAITKTFFVTDSFEVDRPFPRDTVPSNALLTFKWHGEATIPSTLVLGYRWKLDEPNFNVSDSTVKMATYNTGVGNDRVSPGLKKFTLRAVGQSGWRGQSTRFFQQNFAPDTWYSGPDVNDPAQGWLSYPDGSGHLHYYQTVDWANFTGIPHTQLSSDSVQVLPAARPERRTFFEIYGDTLFAHAEGDTVNLNSWVIFPAGGFDQDSPYKVHIGVDPNRPIGPVTTALDSANGSPIGFRSLVITLRAQDNASITPSESSTYPVFDVGSVFHAPHISVYNPMTASGKCYGYAIAEDGDGAVDRRIQREGGAVSIADHVDGGGGSAAEQAVRPKILTFYVNRSPYFLTNDPTFRPRPNTTVTRSITNWNVLATDPDPIDWAKPVAQTGGPQDNTAPVLVRTVTIFGKTSAARDTSVIVADHVEFANLSFTIPGVIVPGAIRAQLQVDDFRTGDRDSHPGRTTIINVPLTLSGPEPADLPQGASSATQRPGSPQAVGRRQ